MEITLTIRDGKPTATSLQIAESFEKQHSHVLRAIRDLMNDLSTTPGGKEFTASNFGFSERLDQTGRKVPFYALTRDGFTLLTMGFTGEKALQFKMAYIDAFNRMEEELAKQNLPSLPAALPALFTPDVVFDKQTGSHAWRFAVSLVHAMEKMRTDIDKGNAYMLPDGVAKITIPDKLFYGWYTDTTLRIPFRTAYSLGILPLHIPERGISTICDVQKGFVFIDLAAF